MAPVVAQQAQNFTALAVWVGAVVLLLVAGGVVLAAARRRLLGEGERGAGEGLSLHDLREMHARGDLTEEEFERAKGAILGKPSPGGPPPGERRARPGFDLTGEPLPESGGDDGGNGGGK